MTRSARVTAQAKVNLLLRVLAREASGYHSIETVFLRLDLGDEVRCLASGLRRAGVEPGDRVVQISENRYEWILVDLAVHVAYRVANSFAAVAVTAVAQLDGLVGTGARTARDRGPAPGAGYQLDLDLDGRIATGIEDLAPDDIVNDAHENSWGQCGECRRSRAPSGSERAFGPGDRPSSGLRARARGVS